MKLSTIPSVFIKDFIHWKKVEYFRRCIYFFLFFNTLSLLPIAQEIWSYNGMAGARGWDFSVSTVNQFSFFLLNVLSHPANATFSWVYIVFIVGQFIFLITGILRIYPKISSILVWFFTTNLFLKGYLMFTGGEILISLLLFYLIFIQQSKNNPLKISWSLNNENKVRFTDFQNSVNNTFYWIILIQICTVYFFSTYYKLFDAEWISGKAVMYISRIDAFSGGMMKWLFAENLGLSVVVTYLILTYQLLFPIVVWFKSIKIPFLLFGVILHLGIAFGMGIFSFGIIMCLVYLPFLDIEQLEKIKQKLSFNKRRNN